jgi:hypothetical protein
MPLTRARIEQVVAALDLELDELAICEACLSFVTFPLDRGDEREVALATTQVTPDLWAEGLALPLQAALERARRRGVAHAAGVVTEVEAFGAESRPSCGASRPACRGYITSAT